MKDKVLRETVRALGGYLGYDFYFLDDGSIDVRPGIFGVTPLKVSNIDRSVLAQKLKIDAFEEKFAAQEESAKPVCKSCGQKIQEGLQVGNVEALAASLKKGGNSKK